MSVKALVVTAILAAWSGAALAHTDEPYRCYGTTDPRCSGDFCGNTFYNATESLNWQRTVQSADQRAMSQLAGVYYGEQTAPQLGMVERVYRSYEASGLWQYQDQTCGSTPGVPCSQNQGTGQWAGYMQPDRLANDAEWNAFRKDDQFLAVAKQVQHNAAPCEDAEFRQFDFWIGDWDVASAADNVQRGSSHISKEMNGCVVWENWTSAGNPYFGKSYNTWNPNLKRWEQYWVDSSAGVMFFHGGLKDNVMDYWTDDVAQATGGKLLRHLQFFNLGPDKVRQFSQGSTDGGATWHTEYDFIYTRAANHGK